MSGKVNGPVRMNTENNAGGAAANNNPTDRLVNHIFNLISQDIAIADKIKSVTEKIKNRIYLEFVREHSNFNDPKLDKQVKAELSYELNQRKIEQTREEVIRPAVTSRIEQQITNAKQFIRTLIDEYLFNKVTGKFNLTCSMRAGQYTFDGRNPMFNRIVLVDYENVRIGLTKRQTIKLENNTVQTNPYPLSIRYVVDYINHLAIKDTNALYILCKSSRDEQLRPFIRLYDNVIECNIIFPEIDSLHDIKFNETDDYVMLALLKLLVDKKEDMFPAITHMPVFIMSSDNYDWFTPKNYKGDQRIRGLKYPYVVYYSPNTGGQWCYYRSANNNRRTEAAITRHKNSEGRYSDVRTDLRDFGYYNSKVFPYSLTEFVSKNITSHPIYDNICSLPRKAKTAKAIPPGYTQKNQYPFNIYEYKAEDSELTCTFNADTGEFIPNISYCNTWTSNMLNKLNQINPHAHARALAETRVKQKIMFEHAERDRLEAEKLRAAAKSKAEFNNAAKKFIEVGASGCNITTEWDKVYNTIYYIYNTRKKNPTLGNLEKMVSSMMKENLGDDRYISMYDSIKDLVDNLIKIPQQNTRVSIAKLVKNYFCLPGSSSSSSSSTHPMNTRSNAPQTSKEKAKRYYMIAYYIYNKWLKDGKPNTDIIIKYVSRSIREAKLNINQIITEHNINNNNVNTSDNHKIHGYIESLNVYLQDVNSMEPNATHNPMYPTHSSGVDMSGARPPGPPIGFGARPPGPPIGFGARPPGPPIGFGARKNSRTLKRQSSGAVSIANSIANFPMKKTSKNNNK